MEMQEINTNSDDETPDDGEPRTIRTRPGSSQKTFYSPVALLLGLLNVLLLAGIIFLRFHHSARLSSAELSTIDANLTERLQAADQQVSSLTEQRDLLNVSLTNMRREMEKLQSLSKQNSAYPSPVELSIIKANLTERLQAADQQVSSLTEQRDLLNVSLTNMRREMEKLQSLSKQKLSTVEANLMERLQAADQQVSSLTEQRDLLNVSFTNMRREMEKLQSLSKQTHPSPAELSTIEANLTEHLQTEDHEVSSLTEQRDPPNVSLTNTDKEMEKVQSLPEEGPAMGMPPCCMRAGPYTREIILDCFLQEPTPSCPSKNYVVRVSGGEWLCITFDSKWMKMQIKKRTISCRG